MRRMTLLVIGVVAGTVLQAGCSDSATPSSPGASAPAAMQTLVDVPLVDVTAGATGTWNYSGQSVTVPAGAYNNITFNWYDFHRAPAAFGTLYVLTQEYLGLPGGLGSAPGLVARSERVVNGEYVFAPEVILNGGVKYWFYTDTQGSFANSFDVDIYGSGDSYVSGIASQPFRKSQASGRMVNGVYVPPPPGVFTDASFRLRGSLRQ